MCRSLKRLVYERDDTGFYDEPVYENDYTDVDCMRDLCSLGWSEADAEDFMNEEV